MTAVATAVFCHFCGQPITRPGKSLHHPRWPAGRYLRICPECERRSAPCHTCGLPIREPGQAGVGSEICPTCALTTALCLACGEQIKGRYIEVDGVGPYCEACYRIRTSCDVCTAPLTTEYWQLSDGRLTCTICHQTAIYLPAEAARLYDDLKALIGAHLNLTLNVPTGLALVDQNQLAEIIRQQGAPADLNPQQTLGIYARQGIRRGIYVQTGLPRKVLLQVVSHEYAHAWQGENCPLLHQPLVREGFAEWVAYKILQIYGYAHQQARMRARTDIYGQGLRWALDLETSHGLTGLLNACRQSN